MLQICYHVKFKFYVFISILQLMKEFPLLGMLNIHENLLEALLELQAYADVQAVLAKYDGKTEHCLKISSEAILDGDIEGIIK